MGARADRHDRCQRADPVVADVVLRNLTWFLVRSAVHPHPSVANWKSPDPDDLDDEDGESEDDTDTYESWWSFMVRKR